MKQKNKAKFSEKNFPFFLFKKKRANLVYEAIIHLILIALIFAMFFMAAVGLANSRDIKQQVIEKQTALLIDSAGPGTTFKISKINRNGIIDKMELNNGEVFSNINGLTLSKGYPYFTRYSVSLDSDNDYFYVRIT